MPKETYVVTVGNHNEEILGEDVLAILEAAFDEAVEAGTVLDVLDKMDPVED
jgi:hypothetical protein